MQTKASEAAGVLLRIPLIACDYHKLINTLAPRR
jgi:hypothetical protein